MPRVPWPLRHGRPSIEIALARISDGQKQLRRLLADTGAGTVHSGFEILLSPADCLMAGGQVAQPVRLQGAYAGQFAVYMVPILIPALRLTARVRVVAVASPPQGFDGIAGFRFLNRFALNFADHSAFGLES